ncbi:MAG: DUF4389 domain-containing protein [Gammaproteobacteria bacterium]|nr:DUF4389 domain-containing protein [Gammaproteobacteria bacterium]
MTPTPPVWQEGSFAVRLIYMVFFYIIFAVTDLILLALLIIQVLSVVVGGAPNPWAPQYSAAFGRYLLQIWAYIGCQSPVKPWPFSPWPAESASTQDEGSEA